jgi:hypothetical protein
MVDVRRQGERPARTVGVAFHDMGLEARLHRRDTLSRSIWANYHPA